MNGAVPSFLGLVSVARWLRCRMESGLFMLLLLALIPVLVLRALILGMDRRRSATLLRRWSHYILYGFSELRAGFWPGICFELDADIYFHIVLIEWFAVLNATCRAGRSESGEGRVLVIKLAHFGDALHVFPMVRELRRQRSGTGIDLLVGPWCRGLAESFDLHDDLIIQTPRLSLFERGSKAERRSFFGEVRWLLELRRRNYDLAISTSTTTLAEVLLMHALRARRWVGTVLPEGLYEPEGEASLVPYDARMYEADRVMSLLDLCGMGSGVSDLFFPLTEQARKDAKALLHRAGMTESDAYAVLCPGAGWPGKQWATERFAQLGDRLRRELGLSIVLAGSVGERNLCAEVARQMMEPVVQLAGKTSLEHLAAILSGTALFVGNDSGPMHMAACFKVPIVAFFGPTVASKWLPRHASVRCLQHEDCSGCVSWHYRARCIHNNRCMNAITVEEAWQSVLDVRRVSGQGR